MKIRKVTISQTKSGSYYLTNMNYTLYITLQQLVIL